MFHAATATSVGLLARGVTATPPGVYPNPPASSRYRACRNDDHRVRGDERCQRKFHDSPLEPAADSALAYTPLDARMSNAFHGIATEPCA